MSLERLWLAAWLDGLHRVNAPAQPAQDRPAAPRPPYVPPAPRTGQQ